jgi:uncharacterized protein (TIGR03437 family)
MTKFVPSCGTLLYLTMSVSAVVAQPQVNAAINAADYTPTLAPGSIAAVFGTDLAPAPAYPSGVPLPLILNSVSVTINGKAAPLFYISALQINFQVPFETVPGIATLQVDNGGQVSNSLQCVIASSALAIFQAGPGYAVVQNIDKSTNSPTQAAARGSVIVVYITGIGPTDNPVFDGAAAPGSPPAKFKGISSATIGDVDAPVQFIGMTPGSVGLAQANLVVPDLPTGTYPMWISLNNVQSVSALVSVKGSGTAFPVAGLLKLMSSFSLPGVGPTQVPGISGVVNNSVAWFHNTLYVCAPSDIKVVDVTQAAAPNFLLRMHDPQLFNSAHNCTVNSAVAKPFLLDLIRATSEIAAYDLSNPAAPVKASQVSIPVVPRSVAYDGNFAFFGEDLFTPSGTQVVRTQGNIASVDLTNIANPVPGPVLALNSAHPETNDTNLRPYMLIPTQGVLYVASTTASKNFDNGTGALDIFDITNAKNIQGIGQILVPGSKMLLTLAMDGTELIAMGDTTGYSPGNESPLDFPFHGNVTITMFDITDPRNPKMQGNVIVDSMPPGNVGGPISLGTVPLGKGFFAVTCAGPDPNATGGGGNGSLVIVDARDPQHPAAYTYGTISGLGGLTVANGYLYAAVGSGANIYQVHLP